MSFALKPAPGKPIAFAVLLLVAFADSKALAKSLAETGKQGQPLTAPVFIETELAAQLVVHRCDALGDGGFVEEFVNRMNLRGVTD